MSGVNLRRSVQVAGVVAVVVLSAMATVSCGPRMMYKSTVTVGTTNPQTAFYAALLAVNHQHYPFALVDANAGVIQTAQISAGHGRWYAFHLQVQPTGEVSIDPLTNMEKVHGNGVVVPRAVVGRAATLGKQIRKISAVKSEQQIVAEGQILHQKIVAGVGTPVTTAVAVPVASPAVVAPTAPTVVAPTPPSGG